MLHRRFLVFFAVAMAMALIGCGGGGGIFDTITTTGSTSTNGSTNGGSGLDLTYNTTWTGGAASPSGVSQRVRLLDMNGNVIGQRITNTADGEQTITFTDVPQGSYIVKTELFSGANATGTVTGILETQVQGQGTISTSVGAALANLRVTPTTASLNIGQTAHFSVSGVDASSRLTFLAPNSVTWSETGTAITTDQNGNVTAVAEGNATLTATHTSGKTDSSAVAVTAIDPNRSKWTVLLFLNAANDLYPFAAPDVNELERVASNSQVRYVVQWKQVQGIGGNSNPLFSGTRRYLVKPDTTNTIKSQVVQEMGVNVDMGRASTLNEFITWGMANYPAERYCVIVWNHGNGWHRGLDARPIVKGVSYDDHTGNAIQTWQLPLAMQGHHVDVFSFDACLMQMLEVQSELRTSTDYIVASEENTPGYGYPYHVIFAPWIQNPGSSTRDLTKSFVDGHVGYEQYQNDVITQSSVQSTKVTAVMNAVDQLAVALIANRADIATIVQTIRTNSMKYAFRGDGRYYYDLWDIANRLQNASTPTAVKTAAQGVKTAVEAAVIWNGFTPLSAGSHGISIDFSPRTAFQDYATDYSLTQLAKDTRWDEWLAVAP
ncbi:MAG: clostripain-related cysteine peptidase [Fimbriimonas sp.]